MKQFILAIAMFVPTLLSAQKNYQPGYIITLKGDTVKGYINYKEWNISPAEISFKSSISNEEAKSYDVNDINYFEVLENESYQRAEVKVSLHAVALSDIAGKDTSYKMDIVFLKILCRGNVITLFSFTDKIKQRFYIHEQGTNQPVELMYREFFGGDDRSKLIIEDVYRNQLKKIIYNRNLNNKVLLKKVEKLDYEESGLKEIAYRINGIGRQDEKRIEVNQPKRSRFFIGAGAQQNKTSFDGDHFFAENSTSTTSILPAISGGIDLFFNPNTGKLLFRTEIGFSAHKSTTTGSNGYNAISIYEKAGSTLSFHPQVVYNIYNKPGFKIPIGIGMGINLCNYSKNVLQDFYINASPEGRVKEDYFKLEKSYVSILARVGVVFKNKIEASIVYQPAAAITKYNNYNVLNSVLQFKITYLFTRNK